MKYTLFINHVVSKSIQPVIEMKDSAPDKAVRINDVQASKSGKFCNINLTLERNLKCSQSSLSEFFFCYKFN